ncbi:hypothetical protein [Flavobacterium terrigena]|uniref:Uncharacterized protein n=1 Tax=Flavobacterium terrigena TaxID=402734 RepID=A0A1H6VE58_9FLAO|nr:hypothetical protein [Flavobacterium terrigena]SEJ02838.1 hypothetical protein SAMN05660918_2202 [Flavobacterium terrigena]
MEQFDEPTQLITKELATDLNNRYIEKRSGLILSNIGKEDANAVWYSIEELENYINYVKTKGIENGIEVNGIRFYIGVYPEDGVKYKEKAGLTTIFLSPTKKRTLNILERSLADDPLLEVNVDVTEIEPLNYGGIGHPPKITYPQE